MKKNDHEQVQSILDGTATEIEFHSFQNRMKTEPQLRKIYRSYALLQHSLLEEFEGRSFISIANTTPKAKNIWVQNLAATAAAVALMAGGYQWYRSQQSLKAEPAMLVFAGDAAWSIEGKEAVQTGPTLYAKGDKLLMERGSVSMSLAKGVDGIFEAPLEMVYEGPDTLHLRSGKAWVRVGQAASGFSIRTDSMHAIDHGTEFAVIARPDAPDELHVFEGVVEMRKPNESKGAMLAAGEAASITPSGETTVMKCDEGNFITKLPTTDVIFEEDFSKGSKVQTPRKPLVGGSAWEVREGAAAITTNGFEGTDFQAFSTFDGGKLGEKNAVLLATLEVATNAAGPFHGPGWAGMSLFANDIELVFFGDSFGDAQSWSLDVKQHLDPFVPESPLIGPQTVTMMYDWRTGKTSLHKGSNASQDAFVSATLPVGLNFDQVRIGSSEGAGIAVKSVVIRIVETPGPEH